MIVVYCLRSLGDLIGLYHSFGTNVMIFDSCWDTFGPLGLDLSRNEVTGPLAQDVITLRKS